MSRWVVLLRGVNVGGVTVRSADLKDCLASAGFERVRTVLASGNAVVDLAGSAREAGPRPVKQRVETALRERFGYDAWVVVLTPERLAGILAAYPWPRRDASHHPYVVFGSDPEQVALLAAEARTLAGASATADERVEPVEPVEPGGDVLFWEVPRGATLGSPFAKAAAARRWKPHVTTRNLRTVEKILAVC